MITVEYAIGQFLFTTYVKQIAPLIIKGFKALYWYFIKETSDIDGPIHCSVFVFD